MDAIEIITKNFNEFISSKGVMLQSFWNSDECQSNHDIRLLLYVFESKWNEYEERKK